MAKTEEYSKKDYLESGIFGSLVATVSAVLTYPLSHGDHYYSPIFVTADAQWLFFTILGLPVGFVITGAVWKLGEEFRDKFF